MYVCTVCMYSMYVCMYVLFSLISFEYVSMVIHIEEHTNVRMCIYVFMCDVCMYVCIYTVCMYGLHAL